MLALQHIVFFFCYLSLVTMNSINDSRILTKTFLAESDRVHEGY